jgi:hypothetical protein
MRIRKGENTAGLDSLKLREYLRKHGDRHIDTDSLVETFVLSRRKAERLIEELVNLELIRRSDAQLNKAKVCYETTIQGNAFGMANAGKPVSRESAEKVLREFLNRVRTVNERDDLAYRIGSVIVFGSYLSSAIQLNDLDLSAELIGKWTDDASYHAACQGSMERAHASRRQFRNLVDEISWPRTEVLLFLKNRSRTISLCDWDSLQKMPKFQYSVLLGDNARIAAFIKDGRVVDFPVSEDGQPP